MLLAINSRKRTSLVEVPITGHNGERDVAPVGNESLAFDENFASFANLASASWQTINFLFDLVKVARIRIKSHTYEGAAPTISCAGKSFKPSAANETQWFDIDANASSVSIFDATGGRTRLYELSIFKRV